MEEKKAVLASLGFSEEFIDYIENFNPDQQGRLIESEVIFDINMDSSEITPNVSMDSKELFL